MKLMTGRKRIHSFVLFLGIAGLLFLHGCSNQPTIAGNCANCHQPNLDDSHQFACTTCHRGDDKGKTEEQAHVGLIAQPAHPDNLEITCGNCHEEQVANVSQSLHYTLRNSVNLIRNNFGATTELTTLTEIPITTNPDTVTELADDLLRRRCLRCHLFSSGDNYSATRHAAGCGACHLSYTDGKLVNHDFAKRPGDDSCLSCHYGNRVGFDYYGRSEHDLNNEYRTPYTAQDTTDRPYGVDYHELVPDIHQQKGMVCIDCHAGNELMAPSKDTPKLSCRSCHDAAVLAGNTPLSAGVVRSDQSYSFTSRSSNTRYTLPVMQHKAHTTYKAVDCQVCHAQWSFNDTQTHLMRSDLDEYDQWVHLTVQGNSEIEKLLEHNLDYDNEELAPSTTDKINGELRSGVWYKGYTMRRWEQLSVGRDSMGNLKVVRPMLNLSLSWVDEDGNVMFDNEEGSDNNAGMLPYIPHTTGPAGLFYEERLREILAAEQNILKDTPNTHQSDDE